MCKSYGSQDLACIRLRSIAFLYTLSACPILKATHLKRSQLTNTTAIVFIASLEFTANKNEYRVLFSIRHQYIGPNRSLIIIDHCDINVYMQTIFNVFLYTPTVIQRNTMNHSRSIVITAAHSLRRRYPKKHKNARLLKSSDFARKTYTKLSYHSSD